VRDVEGAFAFGCWRQLIERIGISIVVAGGVCRVLPDDVEYGLGMKRYDEGCKK
jgi:hypothetical protein